jgi:hypothetical protein
MVHLLSVVGQRVHSCIPQLGLPPSVEASEVCNNTSDIRGTFGLVEFTGSPISDVAGDAITRNPCCVPSIVDEEFYSELIWLQVSDLRFIRSDQLQ